MKIQKDNNAMKITDETSMKKLYWIYFQLFGVMMCVNELSVMLISGKIALWIGLIWIPVSALLYFRINKTNHIWKAYAIINAVIAGIAMSSYYIIKGVMPKYSLMMVALLAVLLWGHMIVSSNVHDKKKFLMLNCSISVVVAVILVLILISTPNTFAAGSFFTVIVYLCFNFSLYLSQSKAWNNGKIVAVASLCMFAGIIFGVLALLSDGESLGIFDAEGIPKVKRKRV